jgi:AcrR family transcriptional regulator
VNKRHEKGLATRQRILAVATRLFTDPGYDATPIEAILGESEVSRGALYHHFASKEQVFEAVFEAIEQDIASQSIEASLSYADPVERLRAGCRFFLRTPLTDSFRQIALIDAPSVLGWQKWREIENRYGLGLLKGALSAAIQSRGRKPEAIEELAHMLLAAMIEGALLVASAEDKDQARQSAVTAVETLIDGIVA